MSIKVYVEGGGDRKDLKTRCRQGFSTFLRKAGLEGRMPRIVASGARQNAYNSFCTAFRMAQDGEFIVLLVDSEAPVTEQNAPWTHLRLRDGWDQPPGTDDDNAHLMVQCMEAWFFADADALQAYYGPHFNANAIPDRKDIENIPKQDLFRTLKSATRNTQEYDKGGHSFGILSHLDPDKVKAASPYANRLIRVLLDKAGG